jgi:hypothetical protein
LIEHVGADAAVDLLHPEAAGHRPQRHHSDGNIFQRP